MEDRHGKLVNHLVRGSKTGFRGGSCLASIAIIISFAAMIFTGIQTYENARQINLLAQQVQFNADETRPFMVFNPKFTQKGAVILPNVSITNISPIPGVLLFHSESSKFGDILNLYSGLQTVGIVYQNQNADLTPDPIDPKTTSGILSGKQILFYSICLLYGPISSSDNRKWILNGLYQMDTLGARGIYFDEESASTTQSTCDSVSSLSKSKLQVDVVVPNAATSTHGSWIREGSFNY